jgi:hypothetical protein
MGIDEWKKEQEDAGNVSDSGSSDSGSDSEYE